jgi:hypothetical protein
MRVREMSFGIALHMDSAELDVGIGKEALADGEQTGEVVLNENHHPPKAPLNQTPRPGLAIQLRTRFLPSRPRPIAR